MSLPVEIQVLPAENSGTRYVFPRRDLGKYHWLGVFPILMGLGMAGFMVFWTVGFAGGFAESFGPAGWLAALVALPGFLGAGTLISVGMLVGFGHAELVATEGEIVCWERCGLLRWKRKVATDVVQQFQVQSTFQGTTNGQPRVYHLDHFSLLMAQTSTGKPRWLVLGYPKAWLLAVAEDLARSLHHDLATESAPQERVITVEEVTVSDPGLTDRWEQPTDSPIIHEEIPGGFSLLVPAPGVWKGSAGLFTFSLLWCGFMVIFSAVAGGILIGGDIKDDKMFWIFPLFSLLFWAIGIGLMIAAINMGRRQAVLAVTHGELKLMQSSLFGTSRNDWQLSELQTVRKGPSGMSVNDVPVMQLQIVDSSGKAYGLLTGRADAELEWMATLLRQQLPHTTSGEPASENANY